MFDDQIFFDPGTLAKSDEVNDNFSAVWGGDYHQQVAIWTTATRPGETGQPTPVAFRSWGFNTDFPGLEVYLGASLGWLIITGQWANDPNPVANSIANGSKGFNTTSQQFVGYDGTDWVILG